MVTVECAPHIHQNARNLVHLEHIAATELNAVVKKNVMKSKRLHCKPNATSQFVVGIAKPAKDPIRIQTDN